jgi:DNA-binding response OmpR family regulator
MEDSKGRVLVIDDEPEIRRNLIFGLTQHGFEVVACPDGISAVHELNRAGAEGDGYDFLVTDIFMPDIDGLKILKVIKSHFPDLPAVVITGFGDETLETTALAEPNTAYLDKPFEIHELVEALEGLPRGRATTTTSPGPAPGVREIMSAYLTVRITDERRSHEVFRALQELRGVHSCHAVHGDVDVILLVQADSSAGIEEIFQAVGSLAGLEVVSVSSVERPKLDRDIEEFVRSYREAIRGSEPSTGQGQKGTSSYLMVDIDPSAIQQVFTTVFFIDDVIFCDVIDDGSRLVAMVTGQGAVGRIPHVVEKIDEIDGVLRVRQARIIEFLDA